MLTKTSSPAIVKSMSHHNLTPKDLQILEEIGLDLGLIQKMDKVELKQAIEEQYGIYTANYHRKPIANTYPTIESSNPTAQIEHEASTGKISEQIMFYLQSRGLSGEECVSLVVSGFCGEILQNLPFEFAMEARELLKVSMEGSVG
jgi:SUF system FeS cluster assembly, SufBD